jgi:hypothetical protein
MLDDALGDAEGGYSGVELDVRGPRCLPQPIEGRACTTASPCAPSRRRKKQPYLMFLLTSFALHVPLLVPSWFSFYLLFIYFLLSLFPSLPPSIEPPAHLHCLLH